MKKTFGLDISTVLFLIFLVLKLTDKIDWSWWWVTSPLWISAAIVILLTGGLFTAFFIALKVSKKK